ncbi:Murein DD-endopeptidase MepM and murein hydrolase activator NlpD, contain LysM domain [Desulfonispora thiosulfatigenes DSM 11270]|uniref:Murein DD-endopeptidase MepM and murein hydrolase activator NlpD, contain LysM domain n=1 Tax=Desulfonispora thiosulfatigenes DSM 11270 TaxID=656914 RepID=A0A1W1UIX9_DESTI|nr:M23 family metallopeptidase [Desulfonispora thiosulfatigenes]SMB80714.1 Murein DD-endopeptidase MepM and murein hydrolase activator NlpD, contain LysM domain [Desulfonispora thiosulfatigenes DSM 11270]
MLLIFKKRTFICLCLVALFGTIIFGGSLLFLSNNKSINVLSNEENNKDYIKWVDFNVPYEAMNKALKLDIDSQEKEVKLNWIELLAYLTAENGNNFKGFKEKQLDAIAKMLESGKTIQELTENMKYYPYYYEAYSAVLSGFLGEYEIEVKDENGEGNRWERRYGLKVFSPIAKTFPYNHYDDFGNSRSYGFKRTHLGNDLMGQVGTPIVAMEGGIVEALGWNKYGGWRIGIRSLDSKRYYYYAHLRKNFPYRKDLKVGSEVKAGDVIGYLGRTGYSNEENVNNIQQAHLHFGMQLIFDESQKESDNEIWIDVYQIIRLLDQQRSEVIKNPETKDYSRVYDIRECTD